MSYSRLLMVFLLTAGLLTFLGPRVAAQATSEFVNGQWFDGEKFTPQTFYSVHGLLTRKKPPIVEKIVDLKNGYVVPPYGDAHTHNLDSPYNIEQQLAMYRKDGIFYVKVLCNSLSGARAVAPRVNIPTSIDVKYAQGGLDGSRSHAQMVYESLGLGYYSFQAQEAHKAEILNSHARENDCYYVVDTQADLDRKWPLILAGKPDFIKVFLLHSEDYEKRKQAGEGQGIDPNVLPYIVAKAHASGLTVSAHVDTMTDWRCALASGVDEMAHLPGYFIGKTEDISALYTLTPEDARQTARRKVWVTPTASLTDFIGDPAEKQRTQVNQIRNLHRLKAAGVKFSIGADNYGSDSLPEALYLSKLSVWNSREMLKMWCEDTPRHIFPGRKIGFLRDGYEASFLVLSGNPMEQFSHVTDITLRYKQGNDLDALH